VILASFLDWLTGVGTAVAAIAAAWAAWIALYVGVIAVRRRRPSLSLVDPLLGRELVVVGTTDGTDSAWVRCAVRNEEGKDAAEDAEVAIMGIREIRPREGHPPWTEVPALAGLALAWSATGGESRAHIPPGGERIIDVAAVYRAESASGLGPLVIQTAFQHADRDRAQALKSGEVALCLAITARNADPVRVEIRLAYDGTWGASVWDHLHVTVVDLDVAGGP
jgi:hypothetical protein